MKRFLVGLCSIGLLLITSCEKEEGVSTVGITVQTEAGVPIQNCNVSLTVPVVGAVEYFGQTDENGYIEFGSGLHVYYDVTVWKGIWEGCDFVELNPGNSFQKTVIIYPPNTAFNGCI